jgi:hypothetical protein
MLHLDPRFVLIDVHNPEDPDGNYYIVENFNKERHLGRGNWSRPGETFFTEMKEVAHLRDRILN